MPKLPRPSNSEPVPVATYKVRLLNYEHGHSSNKGTPQITWKSEIIDGEFEGRQVRDVTYMGEASLWRVANLLGACGLDFPEGIDTDSPFFNTLCQKALGRTTYWNVGQKNLESGTTVNEVKDYRADYEQEVIEVVQETDAPAWVEE